LPRMTVKWVCALFRQRGGGGDVIVVVLAVAGRTMLQQTVAPNINIAPGLFEIFEKILQGSGFLSHSV